MSQVFFVAPSLNYPDPVKTPISFLCFHGIYQIQEPKIPQRIIAQRFFLFQEGKIVHVLFIVIEAICCSISQFGFYEMTQICISLSKPVCLGIAVNVECVVRNFGLQPFYGRKEVLL